MGSIERFLALAGAAWCVWSTPARADVGARAPTVATTAAAAPSPSREQCLGSHERAQSARLAGGLLAARDALRQCADPACPSLVSRDCLSWLTEVEQQIPSVIFRASKDGEDLERLSIREGNLQLTDSLTGTPLDLEPGPHHFTAELPGFPAQEATYVLQAGDKGRVVRFEFSTPKPSPAAVPPPERPLPATELERPIPNVTIALGATALVAGVAGAVLGAMALSERSDLEESCAPLCDSEDQRKLTNLALGADISLVVAVVAAGGAVYSYATRPSVNVTKASARLAWGVGASRSAWSLTAGGRF